MVVENVKCNGKWITIFFFLSEFIAWKKDCSKACAGKHITVLKKKTTESYLDNVLLVLEEMSWVLYFVHPCASGIQNRLYKIALGTIL